MKLHERQVIEELFTRLAQAGRLPLRQDADTARLIHDLVARQPEAPYLMVQTILVQAQALRTAQESLDALGAGHARLARSKGGGSRDGRPVPVPPVSAAVPSDGFLAAASSVAMVVGGAIAVEATPL